MLSTFSCINVFAAAPPTVYTYPSISSSKYIEFTAQENINVYKDTACKTRGTKKPEKKYNASIAKNDVCYIYKIASSYIEVNYPTSSGRRTGYIERSALFDKTEPVDYIDSSAHKVQIYKTKNGGYVAKGDKVWKVDPKKGYSGYRAVIYDAKSGNRAYKMGYVTLDGWDDIVWNDVPVVDYVDIETDDEDNADYSYVSKSEIEKAIKELGVKENSKTHKALKTMNSVYSKKLSASDKKGTCIFLFEGVGKSSKTNERFNAVCVVVKNGKIKYTNKNSTTIPDYPFTPKNNKNSNNMPTLISGIYGFHSHNHGYIGKDGTDRVYAALKIESANVLRFKKDKTYYEEKGVSSINIHRRSYDDLSKSLGKTWANSAGCMNIGKAGTGKNSEYSKFVKAVGIVDSSWSGYADCKHTVKGKVIIDREYADNYLSEIGYPKKAIAKLK